MVNRFIQQNPIKYLFYYDYDTNKHNRHRKKSTRNRFLTLRSFSSNERNKNYNTV